MLKIRLMAYALVLSSLAIMSPSALAQTSPSRGPAGTPNGNNPSGGSNTPISTPFFGGTGGVQSVAPGSTVTAPTAPGAAPTITFTPAISTAITAAAIASVATFVAPGSTPTQQTLGAFFTGNTAVVAISTQAVPGGVTLVTLQNGVVTGTQVLTTFSQVFAQASNLISALGSSGALGGAGTAGTAGGGGVGTAGTAGGGGVGTAISIQVGDTKVTISSANGRAGRGEDGT
jgi:hypothetical protein